MKTSLKHCRLSYSESIALIKDDESGVRNWRYRYFKSGRGKTIQLYNDYPYKKFKDIDIFKEFVKTVIT